jgi:hypothetical protein
MARLAHFIISLEDRLGFLFIYLFIIFLKVTRAEEQTRDLLISFYFLIP